MILKNLLRRKTRTLLTVLGIAIGVAAIVALGALVDGLDSGYSAMLGGSRADLVVSQPNTFDISYSTVDEAIGEELAAMPEVSAISGMLQGFAQAEGEPMFFVFGYPQDSFVLDRFQVIEGAGLGSSEARQKGGKPILLGSAAAEVLDKSAGDTLRLTGSVFRIVGIYQTGDAFEDSGALLDMQDAQDLLGRPRQVSLYYLQLKDSGLRQRFTARMERQWPDLSVGSTQEFTDSQNMQGILAAFIWIIGGLVILLGGIGMMNTQLMSVYERTREIGVLRAIGWSRTRVIRMILGESILVCLAGGLLGLGLGWLTLAAFSRLTVLLGAGTSNIHAGLVAQALMVVLVLGLAGGLYPAWRAAQLQPVEALRYEGGSGGKKARRFPVGGMAVQSLWQRSTRTLLTLTVIGLTVGAILAIEGVVQGFADQFTESIVGVDAQVMLRQADVADSTLSAVDERVGDQIAALPQVAEVSGLVFTAVIMPESGSFFILQGYQPGSSAIERFKIIEGKPLSGNRQVILGRMMAESMHKDPGDAIELSGTRFRIVGIYETGVGWEEAGGVITLRDAQTFVGRPRKVTMYAIRLQDQSQAQQTVEWINDQYPDVHASLAGEFVEQLPDMQNSSGMTGGISFLAVLVGGLGVLNTMLMAVFERTREIGVLRALGWRRRAILRMILEEAALLGLLGGAVGISLAFGLLAIVRLEPSFGAWIAPQWEWSAFLRALGVALLLGLAGGLYPAYRATRLQPVEALRYE